MGPDASGGQEFSREDLSLLAKHGILPPGERLPDGLEEELDRALGMTRADMDAELSTALRIIREKEGAQ